MDMTSLKKIKTNRLMQLVLFVPTLWMFIVSSLGIYRLFTHWKDTTVYMANLALLVQVSLKQIIKALHACIAYYTFSTTIS